MDSEDRFQPLRQHEAATHYSKVRDEGMIPERFQQPAVDKRRQCPYYAMVINQLIQMNYFDMLQDMM